MENKFYLRAKVIGSAPEVIIDEDRFSKIKISHNVLFHAFSLEEKYSLVVENYLELEREAVNISVSDMVSGLMDYEDFFKIKSSLNLRLVNLLSSVRLYRDQLLRHVRECVPEMEGVKGNVEMLFSAEFDSNFEFRFMEALRNYVQHCGIPIHRVKCGGAWTSLENGFLEYSMCFYTQKDELLRYGSFKSAILKEMPDEVNLRHTSRKYIECISHIHSKIRDLISSSVSFSREEIRKAIDDYKAALGNQEKMSLGLYAFSTIDNKVADEVVVLLKWDDVREKLVKRNRKLSNLSKRFVSSKAH